MAASTVIFCYTIDGQDTTRSGNDSRDHQAHLKFILSLLDEEKRELARAAEIQEDLQKCSVAEFVF